MSRKSKTKHLRADAATQEFRQFAWNLVGALSDRKTGKPVGKPRADRRTTSKKVASK